MRARVVTYGLVALLAVCAVVQVEWWPLTAFRLFSQPRTATATAWEVDLVDAAGAEHAVPFDRLPRGFRGAHHLAPTLAASAPGRRDAVCRAWAAAGGRRLGVAATEVRVYRLTGRVPTGPGDRVPPPRRALATTCAP